MYTVCTGIRSQPVTVCYLLTNPRKIRCFEVFPTDYGLSTCYLLQAVSCESRWYYYSLVLMSVWHQRISKRAIFVCAKVCSNCDASLVRAKNCRYPLVCVESRSLRIYFVFWKTRQNCIYTTLEHQNQSLNDARLIV